ncbi:MAG: epoxyqueuosine reductase QueH [Oscillospiraceae bacterium]|nr:epoxyqueuosine reductase QueH [Oscillospiraceae bacterium]
MQNDSISYHRQLGRIIEQVTQTGVRPRVLLHCCCAPCSSYVLDYLTSVFDVTCYYFNPNIFPEEEYQRRRDQFDKLFSSTKYRNDVYFMEGDYQPNVYYSTVKGFEQCKEGKDRCLRCYALRLLMTAKTAEKMEYDYFTTTLTVSPHKNADDINQVGLMISQMTGINWLPSDFKKSNGFIKSIELSRNYGLYRQSYCGCVYSFSERMKIGDE